MAVYRTTSGDTWDLIAHKVLGNGFLMDQMIQANPEYCEVFAFPAGIQLNIPEMEDEDESVTVNPPWFVDGDDDE